MEGFMMFTRKKDPKKIISLFSSFFLLWSVRAYAAPNVTGVSGDFSHKSTVTITGSSFGTKPINPATGDHSPLVWDDGSGVTDGDLPSEKGWSGGWPTGRTGEQSVANLQYRSVNFRGVNGPHLNTSHYLVGCGWGWAHGGASGGVNVVVWKTFNISKPQKVFMSYYMRHDPNWTFGGDNNIKMLDWSSGTNPYSGSGYWYTTYHYFKFAGDSKPWGAQRCSDYYAGYAVSPWLDWVKVELAAIYADSNGKYDLWDNCVKKIDTQAHGCTNLDGFGGTTRTQSIGGFQRPHLDWSRQPYKNNYRYFADLYMDTTLARVVIGDNGSYDSCTKREIQIPVTWSDSSLSVKMNYGSFADGDQAYLFVVDESGSVSSGFGPINLGAGSGVPAMPPDFTGTVTNP
jgi:hypothetical protein